MQNIGFLLCQFTEAVLVTFVDLVLVIFVDTISITYIISLHTISESSLMIFKLLLFS